MSDNSTGKGYDLTQKGDRGFKPGEIKEFNVEKEKLRLARWVLTGMLILFLISFLSYVAKSSYVDTSATKEVFDFVKVSFPPIVTLILGAYYKPRD